MAVTTVNTITLNVYYPGEEQPRSVQNIPWYAGITALQTMIVADAMTEAAGLRGQPGYNPKTDFSFRVTFSSVYGAFVDAIGGQANADGKYWMLYIQEPGSAEKRSDVGVSEAIVHDDNSPGKTAVVEWRYEAPSPEKLQRTKDIAKAVRL